MSEGEGTVTAGRAGEAEPERVLAALGEVIGSISKSGFRLDDVLQTIIRHAVESASKAASTTARWATW